jgi:hypothetical protein
MTHRIRFYLLLAAMLPMMSLSWNSGHTAGLKDMAREYNKTNGAKLQRIADIRTVLCELPTAGAVCMKTKLPVRKPI